MSGCSYTINLGPNLPQQGPGIGPFVGMTPAALNAAIGTAQNALIALVTGGQPVTVSYAEGQGHRQVTYNRADADQLRRLIRDLKAALGYRTGGALVPRFG